jgi:hypothetical protein
MATWVNFTIFEKRFFFCIQRCITCNNSLHKNGQIFFLNFNSKINKQLSLKTVSIINLFITYLFIIKKPYLSETERIEVLMVIGYGDRRRSCTEVMTLLMTHKK